jgi:hypothetical protein
MLLLLVFVVRASFNFLAYSCKTTIIFPDLNIKQLKMQKDIFTMEIMIIQRVVHIKNKFEIGKGRSNVESVLTLFMPEISRSYPDTL